jgi:DNA-directed RNA polymerase subunit K/omega
MSEIDQLSEISDKDLEQQIDNSDDELILKENNDSDDDENPPLPPDHDESDEEDNIPLPSDHDESDEEEDDNNDEDINEEEDISEVENIKEVENTNNINLPITLNDYVSSDDDEDDVYDENEFKKIDQETKQDYLLQYHQESKIHNFDEILALTKIARNKKNIIIDELHKTIPMLTKYEKTRILGERTKQINNGSKPFVDVANDIIDGYLIATKELEEKKIPFIIRRPIPSGGSEYWHLKDLEVI